MVSIFIINDMTPEEKKIYNLTWYHANKPKLKNKKRTLEERKRYRIEYNNKYVKQRKQSDPLFKLKYNIRTLIGNSIRNKGYIKPPQSSKILGCTLDEFKQYIESQFEPWMTWDNYGCKSPSGPNTTWDIDHIIPLNSATTEEDIIKLNHYTNLRPLCSYNNRFVKRGKNI